MSVRGVEGKSVAVTEQETGVETTRSRRKRGQRGMTTAEYAVGTIATVSFAGVLIKILTDERVQKILFDLIKLLLELFLPGAGR